MDVYCFDENEKDFARNGRRSSTPAERKRERCLFNHRERMTARRKEMSI
jgi:hypothetical protein